MINRSRGDPIKNEMRVINDFRGRGKLSPSQVKIHTFIKSHPNCTIRDITNSKEFKNDDFANIRQFIRKLVESHRIIQRFSVN